MVLTASQLYSQEYYVDHEPKVVVVHDRQDVIYYHKYHPREIHVYEGNNEIQRTTEQVEWKQTIWFREDRYKINTEYNHIALYNIAHYLESNPCFKILITGYASKKHGSYAYNQQLAAKRCYAVKNYLVDVYNVHPNRIYVKIRGTNNPEYYIDKWNQCVIINKLYQQ